MDVGPPNLFGGVGVGFNPRFEECTWAFPNKFGKPATSQNNTQPSINHMRHWNFITIIGLLCASLPLLAQRNPQPHFRNYSTEHGLPSPEVYCAFEDSRGYLWFGTDNGAARFDGYEFRNFGARDGLTSNVIFDIHEGQEGRIWFGTMTGEAFILEGDTIIPYAYNQLVLKYRSRYKTATLGAIDKDKKAYFALEELGVLIIDSLGRDSLISTNRPISNLLYYRSELVKPLIAIVNRNGDQKYDYWFKNQRQKQYLHVQIFSEGGNQEVEAPWNITPYTPLGNYSIFTAASVFKSDTFFLFGGNGALSVKNGELLWSRPFFFNVTEVIVDGHNAIWVCLNYGEGLLRFSSSDGLRRGEGNQFLHGFSISDFLEDSRGGLWVSTQEKGVFYCNNPDLLVYDTRFGFTDDFVSTITFKNDSILFAGCENGDVFEFNIQSDSIHWKKRNHHGYNNFDLLYDTVSNRLWCHGTYLKNGEWEGVWTWSRNYKYIKTLYSQLKKLQIDKNRNLLGIHYNAGLTKINLEEEIISYRFSEFFGKKKIYALHLDQNENIWLGLDEGIFHLKDNELIRPGIDHPAFHHRVEDIDGMSDGSLVFGTKGYGLIRWLDDQVEQITEENGLTSDMIEDVHVDENGMVWVATLNGLNKVVWDEKGNRQLRRFTVENGLPSNEIYQIKSWKGQVWLCTAGGLVRFREHPQDDYSPFPILQKVQVNNREHSLQASTQFPYDQSDFVFEFLAINYRMNGNIPYRYRLQKDAEWQYTKNRSVNYPSLTPGDYAFELQAQNEDGYWSESTTYAFSILPPWWASWWFRGLSILSLGLLATGVYWYRIRQLRRENELHEQVGELEKAALQAQMNPHFIFNCLNSIQNFILQNEKKKAVEYLARFARLVRHNLNASVNGQVSLEEEVQILENYLSLERERFHQSFAFSIQLDEQLEGENIFFPPLLIQPYVENAVIHGLKKKEGDGKVEVVFEKENGRVSVTIRDNGEGYRLDEEKKKRSRHQSVGMSITQKRLELLGQNSGEAVQIKLLRDAKGEVAGTEVKVRLTVNG
jgi:hypothetical protein